MPSDPFDEVLAELIEAWEERRVLSLQDLQVRWRGREATAARAFAAFERYRSACDDLASGSGAPALALARGARLGDFEVVDRLARGGMGVVYRARQLSLGGRVVALKVMPAVDHDPAGVQRFQRESSELAGLHHPHLAEVYGFGKADGALFYAMCLVEGPSLRDVLERLASDRSLLGQHEVRRGLVSLAHQVADALCAVHARQLVHRDVKPANVVLKGIEAWQPGVAREAILVDFGLVRASIRKG